MTIRRFGNALLGLALGGTAMVLAWPAGAGAATITVTTALDGTSPGPAICTLRDAITAANTNAVVANAGCTAGDPSPTIDEIDIPASANAGGGPVLNSAPPDISSDLDIVGPGAGQISIHRSATAPTDFRVLSIDFGATASISGVTITNGLAHSGGGGGIGNSGTLTLDHVVVAGNQVVTTDGSLTLGGGIASSGTLHVDHGVITGNAVHATFGGGTSPEAEGGGLAISGAATIDRSTIADNVVTADNTGVTAGAAATGGGIQADSLTATISRSTIEGNTVTTDAPQGTDAFGGAIEANSEDVTIDRTTITGNATSSPTGSPAQPDGGGLYQDGIGTFTLKGSTVASNKSPNGANVNGGAVFLDTIVADPQGGGLNCSGGGFNVTNGHNLEDDAGASCAFSAASHDLIGADPMLDPAGLVDNGGPTGTIALLPGSPAIDAGVAAGATTDQRELKRPSDFGTIANAAGGDGADIGAFELQDTVAPDTILGAHPRKKTRKRKARFTFSASEPGSHFECKLDKKAFAPCTSPDVLKHLTRSRHTFQVEAIDAAGNPDPSPVSFRFKVRRLRRH